MKGETMTLTEISRYFHLNETIQKNREALKFLRERAEPAAPSLNGMPHASGVKDSTGRLAVEIADMDARITYLEEQAEQERDKAVTFLLHDSGRTPVSDLPSALCPLPDMGRGCGPLGGLLHRGGCLPHGLQLPCQD